MSKIKYPIKRPKSWYNKSEDLNLDKFSKQAICQDLFSFIAIACYPKFQFNFNEGTYEYLLVNPLREWIIYKIKTGQNLFNSFLYIAPRGGIKSSTCNIAFSLCIGVNLPELSILVLSKKESMATDFGLEYRNIIENPNHSNFKLLTDIEIKDINRHRIILNNRQGTQKEANFNFYGIYSGIISGHYDIIIIDDPIDIFSAWKVEQRDKLDQVLGMNIEGLKKPNTLTIYLTTRYHMDDLADRLLKKGIKHTPQEIWRAIQTNEQGQEVSYFPRLWSLEKLQAKREEVGTPIFNAQYQNDPTQLGEANFFKIEHIKTWDVLPKCDFKVISIDPAITETASSDYTAIQVWGKLGKELYCLEAYRGKHELYDIGKKVQSLAEYYSVKEVVIETVGGFKAVAQYLRKEYPHLRICEYNPGRESKEIRAFAVIPLFEKGLIWLEHNENLIGELLGFPFERNDDQVDALTCAINYLSKRNTVIAKDSYWGLMGKRNNNVSF